MVRLDQRLADGETKAESAQLRPSALLERIENFWQRFRVDTYSRIRDRHA